MAELLVANGVPGASWLATNLESALSEEYLVVSEPQIRGVPLDAVIVGQRGLFLLHRRDWGGEIEVSRRGPWRERRADGSVEIHENPSREQEEASRGLRAFLRDEGYPESMPIHHLIVLTDPAATVVADGSTGLGEPYLVRQAQVPEVVSALDAKQGPQLAEPTRRALAEAIAEGHLGATERVKNPFVFRSSGFLGRRQQAWTVREAVLYMDRNPEDGIHHLRNDSLARWLTEEGAPHLAAVARQSLRNHPNEPRAALEEFLVATGQVPRPKLRVRPRRVDLGYAIAGQTALAELRLDRGRGRGYLYGRVEPAEPWLRVEPSQLQRGALHGMVMADTSALLLRADPYQTTIKVRSNASEEPIDLPVQLRVMPMPSRLTQGVLRPLIAGVLSGILGVLIGVVAMRSGLAAPAFVAALPALGSFFWPAAIGLFWFVLGVVRGAHQPSAWPLGYASWRWLLRTLFWGLVLSILAILVLISGQQVAAQTGGVLPANLRLLVMTMAISLATLPATVGELQASRAATRYGLSGDRGWGRRSLAAWVLVGVLLVGLAFGGVSLFNAVQEWFESSGTLVRAEVWLTEQLAALDDSLNRLVDRLYVWYYDRPAGG